MNIIKKEITLKDGRTISIETGKLAKQANGSVVVRMGDTMLLATVVSSEEAREGVDFLPLSVDYQEKFAGAAAGRFGSGWAWLCVKDSGLCVCSTPNQDNPTMKGIAECGGTPILGIDVWEHAYYLNYQNRRPDYISAFWEVVNWNAVADKYAAAK